SCWRRPGSAGRSTSRACPGGRVRCGSTARRAPRSSPAVAPRRPPDRRRPREVAPVPAGEAFSAHENYEIQHAVDNATRVARLPISVFVGSAESQARPYAERLHASLADPGNSVLIFVDPGARRLEIVTGSRVTNIVTDAD